MAEILLALVFALSAIVLALLAIDWIKWPFNRKCRAYLIFLAAAVNILTSVVMIYINNNQMDRIESRIEKLMEERSRLVMEAPPQAQPIAPAGTPTENLEILSPITGEVAWRPIIEGTISDPKSDVLVIVHPMGLSSYWVQPAVSVRRGGGWQVQAYIGRAGEVDIGNKFEVMAVSKPQEDLSEGRVMASWPISEWRSDIVTVIRK